MPGRSTAQPRLSLHPDTANADLHRQSIKLALEPDVFAANDSITWSTVTAAISSFLTDLWQRGGLMGAKPSSAFTVNCGLGSTMTAQDVLNGYMIVAVTLR